MLEQEFESKKIFLLGKLPEYLKSKGINSDSNFTCLNPNDKNHMQSMSYDAVTNTVKCFNCHRSFNIFDLIGFDYSLSNFSQQFAKAYELYIGKLPIGFVEILSRQNSNIQRSSENTVVTHTPPKKTPFEEPVFEIADDSSLKQDSFIPFGQNDTSQDRYPQFNDKNPQLRDEPFGGISIHNEILKKDNINPQRGFNSVSPFDEARLHPFNSKSTQASNTQNNGFASVYSQNQPQPTQAHNSFAFNDSNQMQSRFGENEISPFQNLSAENIQDYSAFVGKAAANILRTDYFQKRGLSGDVIARFRLGFDDNYPADIDKITGQQIFWKAAIIPFGNQGYTARNTDINEVHDNRYKKKGHAVIFNEAVLEKEGDIFITEGEFDALSLETLGYSAVSLGGTGNIHFLIEKIKKSTVPHSYYICLDNDAQGIEATNQLANLMFPLGLNFKCINLAFPYKDVNEALCKNREMLKNRVDNLSKILSFHFDGISGSTNESLCFIENAESLSRLNFSNSLYSFCGKAQILRRLVSDLISRASMGAIYAAPHLQTQIMKNILLNISATNHDKRELSFVKILSLDENDIEKRLLESIESQIIQGNSCFTVFIDLTSFEDSTAIKQLGKLGSIAEKYKITIVVLCNNSIQQQAEALSVQNIHTDISENGEFIFRTQDRLGRPISFVRNYGN